MCLVTRAILIKLICDILIKTVVGAFTICQPYQQFLLQVLDCNHFKN